MSFKTNTGCRQKETYLSAKGSFMLANKYFDAFSDAKARHVPSEQIGRIATGMNKFIVIILPSVHY
jgi:hypothetical protein